MNGGLNYKDPKVAKGKNPLPHKYMINSLNAGIDIISYNLKKLVKI